jgi:hypothetical protein
MLNLALFDPNQLFRLQIFMRKIGPGQHLITRNHNGGTCAFAFGKFASGSHADFQLLRFATDDWAIKVWLM